MGVQSGLLGDAEIAAIARQSGIAPKEAMLALLEQGAWPLRFARDRDIFTAAQQAALLRMRVLIAGCGGLGGWVADFLARMGAGYLRLCDCDVFEESNLNRQRFCNAHAIGKPKAELAHAELAAIAPHMEIEPYAAELDADNLPALLQGIDAAIDCLDSVPRKKMLERACAAASIPYLHGAVLGQDGFIYLDIPGKARLEALHPDAPAENRGAGGSNVLATTVAGVASLMAAMLVNALILHQPAPEPMIHADFSLPSLEAYGL